MNKTVKSAYHGLCNIDRHGFDVTIVILIVMNAVLVGRIRVTPKEK